ncbi:MAG: response regulator [Gemmatimonadetes bacterium]|nr:response regulator [Gemmatimonadota bacterium]
MAILIVEDDAAVRRGHQKLLEQAGFEVLSVEDGLEAFEELSKSGFDAIVCDVDMPALDGTGFFEQLEEILPHMASRVLFVTGLADQPETHRFLKETGQPFLSKPTPGEELVSTVRRLIELRESGAFDVLGNTPRRTART